MEVLNSFPLLGPGSEKLVIFLISLLEYNCFTMVC